MQIDKEHTLNDNLEKDSDKNDIDNHWKQEQKTDFYVPVVLQKTDSDKDFYQHFKTAWHSTSGFWIPKSYADSRQSTKQLYRGNGWLLCSRETSNWSILDIYTSRLPSCTYSFITSLDTGRSAGKDIYTK